VVVRKQSTPQGWEIATNLAREIVAPTSEYVGGKMTTLPASTSASRLWHQPFGLVYDRLARRPYATCCKRRMTSDEGFFWRITDAGSQDRFSPSFVE